MTESEHNWVASPEGTAVAQKAFPAHEPNVQVRESARSRAVQYYVEDTPYGEIEVTRLGPTPIFLVAASRPPCEMSQSTRRALPPGYLEHLSRQRLRPWKETRVRGPMSQGFEEVLLQLATPGSDAGRTWSPLVRRVESPDPLFGRDREALARTLARLAMAQAPRLPFGVPVLEALPGTGRRAVAAHAAEQCGGQAFDLPLRHVLTPRFMSEPAELALELFLRSEARNDGDVLIVSGFELLLVPRTRGAVHILEELIHLPQVIPVSRPMTEEQHEALAGLGLSLLPMVCPGISPGDARELARDRYRDLEFADDTFEFLARRASVNGLVNPGRLLYLLGLLAGKRGSGEGRGSNMIYRDEVALASGTARRLWSQG